MPGELSAKAVAKSFWHCEVEKELQENGIREKWTFSAEKKGDFTGTNDNAMEFIDQIRCDSLYSHTYSRNCKAKGTFSIAIVNC